MIRIGWVLALALPGLGACAGTEHCACAGGMSPGTSTEACECGPGSDASQASPDASDAGVRPSPDASDAGVRPPATDGQVDSTGASFALPVCTGSPDVRLALTQQAARPTAAFGDSVLDEHGGYFALILGDCTALVHNGPGRPTVSVSLSAEEADELATAVSARQWGQFAAVNCYTVFDLPEITLTADDVNFTVQSCNPDSPDRRPWNAFSAFAVEIGALYQRGAPVEGLPVRYSIVKQGIYEILPPQFFDGAPTWPLGDAVPSPGPDGDIAVHTAYGQDADELRAIRTRWMGGEWGGPYPATHQIPIYDSDGQELLLYMRDVLPEHEDGSGAWTFTDG